MGLNQTNSNAVEYGAKYVFLVSGLISAVSTALIPLAASVGFVWFVIVRLLQAIVVTLRCLGIGVICTRWASLSEVAKFIALMTCFSPIANSFTNIVAGVICDSSLGWPWVHYFHPAVSAHIFDCRRSSRCFLFILWGYFYNDDPAASPFVSTRELAIIHRDKSEAHKKHSSFVPLSSRHASLVIRFMHLLQAICTNKVVWAVWIAAFADLFSGFFLFIYAHANIHNNQNFLRARLLVDGNRVCGYISDTYHCMPERKKMWIFNSVALLTPAAIYLYLCLPAAGPARS
ncbi:MFS domain-containing protein [Aphelenchoides fujianensis]|nr:MFS domain-containing protein [Aphelenchoides fujianensis]